MDDIKTNKRLFDLVRYQRSELFNEGLITEDEYLYILADAPLAQGEGSPSPRRLEDYDQVKASHAKAMADLEESKNTAINKWVARLKVAEDALRSVIAHDGPGFQAGTCAEIARVALDSGNSKDSQA